ncbi:hypothetical protein QBC46DRAFT_364551 [Diplogelasinospora grovesii]|uniref:NDT80 domain-containing protein n=1 Tax=Diplogelasinospora grovesii TaxID=303347 RepID=A0AAN6N620_9PEZI|nr:hypothetical protein QBC46DRAFT_364551 [Diplogelasinospora grovesii]
MDASVVPGIGQDSTSSLSTIDAPAQPSPFINLIPPTPPVTYSPDGSHFYPPAPNVFPSLDVRPQLGSNSSTPGPGMAHAPRSTALPHPGTQISTRDIYSSATPSFRRQPDHHIPRSPSFPGIRRHPLSPTTSPISYNPLKMDAGYGSKGQQNIPPLNPMTSLGMLSYADGQGTPIKVEINGTIDKGFFLADNEWTCYRRNYFSCVCSYSLSPLAPNFPNAPMQFTQSGTQQTYTVYGFAMCISAVVADNDNHAIELVQHTPKRDKGPVAKPDKVRLSPKPPQPNHHPLSALYGSSDPSGGLASSRAYDHPGSFGQPHQGSAPTEHTFERIQFKQATANNGKRRAAQQYYHLLVELWADVGSQGGSSSSEPFVKVAYKKSAKMIVRGRSPGHYQSERRGSTSSGPGGSGGGSIGGGGYASGIMGGPGEYSSGPGGMLSGGYGNSSYDPRSSSSSYGGSSRHHLHHHNHHDLTLEPMITAEEVKSITEPKGYQYFPAPIYEGSEQQDPRHHQHPHQQVDEHDGSSQQGSSSSSGISPSMMTTSSGGPAVKSEMMDPSPTGALPSLFYPGPGYYAQQRCSRFEGKAGSSGYYPTIIPPTSTLNMT